jgi:hypothetical protein
VRSKRSRRWHQRKLVEEAAKRLAGTMKPWEFPLSQNAVARGAVLESIAQISGLKRAPGESDKDLSRRLRAVVEGR